jgi:hypothetical protein
MLTDLEFAEEQYRQLLKMANFYGRTMPQSPEKDALIEQCVNGMADCLARIRELRKKEE